MAEKHRFRRDQGRARPHGVEPQAALDFRFGFRQLRLVVDAQHFAGLRRDDGAKGAVAPRNLDHVGQIKLLLRIIVFNALQPFQRPGAVERHQTGVALADLAFLHARVLVLANRQQLPIGARQQTAITGGVGRFETKRHDAGAGRSFFEQQRKSFWPHQWRVGKNHQNIVEFLRQRLASGQHRMGRAPPLGLHEDSRIGRRAQNFGLDVSAIRPDHHGKRVHASPAHRVKDVSQHAAAGDLVQGLWQA